MKRVKFLLVMSLIIVSTIVICTGCEKRIKMDADKCAEVALEYLKEKYQTEFEIIDSWERKKFIGAAGYAEVIVNHKEEGTDNRYVVVVYPDGSTDENEDGYYDSYKVVSDTYMCHLFSAYVKNEVDKILTDVVLTRFISIVSIQQEKEIQGFLGFSEDFPILNEETFCLTNILDDYIITVDCYLKIPESEKSDVLQNNITSIMLPLISNDLITFTIDVYDDETYLEIEELRKNNIGYNVVGKEMIYFSIKEENEDGSEK